MNKHSFPAHSYVTSGKWAFEGPRIPCWQDASRLGCSVNYQGNTEVSHNGNPSLRHLNHKTIRPIIVNSDLP